jgi:hypothetical protein
MYQRANNNRVNPSFNTNVAFSNDCSSEQRLLKESRSQEGDQQRLFPQS